MSKDYKFLYWPEWDFSTVPPDITTKQLLNNYKNERNEKKVGRRAGKKKHTRGLH